MARAAQAADYFANVEPDGFFQEPATVQPLLTPSVHGRFTSVTWASSYRVYAEDLESRYLYHPQNAQCSVRLFRPGRPRPAAVLVHGYMGGAFALDQHIWPIASLEHCSKSAHLFAQNST